jgi:hypothetical protein
VAGQERAHKMSRVLHQSERGAKAGAVIQDTKLAEGRCIGAVLVINNYAAPRDAVGSTYS